MMGIMFVLKTEELGGEGYIMWSLIICITCQVVGNLSCMEVKVILNRLLIGKWGRKSRFKKPV